MKYFWVLGRMFQPDHDRAIRYLGTYDTLKAINRDIPKEPGLIKPDWCDKCGVFHIIRNESVPSK